VEREGAGLMSGVEDEPEVIVTRVTQEGEIMVTLPSGRVMFMGFLVGARFVIDATRNGFKVTVED
jgi:hypothetical protein